MKYFEFKTIPIQLLELNTGQLAPHLPANPRDWTRQDVADLARSMVETPELAEIRMPIVVPYEDGHYIILGGNMRREAAHYNKEKELLCAVLAEDTPIQKMKEIVLKDNSSFGKFNFEMLKRDWGEFEFQDIGIKFPEVPKGTKKAEEDNYDVSAALKKAGKSTKTKRGDMYRLGDHVLLCGDVTDLNALKKLMGGGISGSGDNGFERNTELADMIVTDPPYNVAISNSDGKTIQNDDMSDGAFRAFLLEAFQNTIEVTKLGGAAYIWMASSEIDACIEAFEKAGWLYKQLLIWVKNSFTLGRQDYQWQHESCIYGWKPGAGHYFSDSRRESSVIDSQKQIESMTKNEMRLLLKEIFEDNGIPTTALRYDKPRKDDEHPTMKPIPMIGEHIKNSSRIGEIVLDTFGGSGTTLIACEQLGRRCRILELDPVYCDVIIDRWQKLTGKRAVKISSDD